MVCASGPMVDRLVCSSVRGLLSDLHLIWAHLRACTSCVVSIVRHVTTTTLSETEDAQRGIQKQTVGSVDGALMDFVVRVTLSCVGVWCGFLYRAW